MLRIILVKKEKHFEKESCEPLRTTQDNWTILHKDTKLDNNSTMDASEKAK